MTICGYVKFPREIAKRSWFDKPNTLKLYITLLCNAAFKDIEREDMTIKKGQYVTSSYKLAEMCNLGRQQVKTALAHLIATNDITVQTNSKFSIITLNNYPAEEQINQQVNQQINPQVNPQVNHISRSSKEERKEEGLKEGAEVSAAPTAAPAPSLSNNSFSDESAAADRQSLVEKYGSSMVAFYEKKFAAWAATRRAVNVTMYPTIAKWLAQDVPPKSASNAPVPDKKREHIDVAELERRIMAQYKNGTFCQTRTNDD